MLVRFSLNYRSKAQSHGLNSFLSWTNGATSCKAQDVYEQIDKVELIGNGNYTIFSLTGVECRVWAHTFLQQRARYYRSEVPAIVQIAHVVIPFGHDEFDNEHWLPLEMFQDVELRITYSPTIAATSFATGTGNVVIYGSFWEQGLPGTFGGFFRLTEQEYFASLAAGDHNYDLPTGNDYLAVGVYVMESGVSPAANITDLEINVNNGQWIPVIGEFEDLNALFSSQLKVNTDESGVAYESDTDSIDTYVGDVETVQLEPEFTHGHTRYD